MFIFPQGCMSPILRPAAISWERMWKEESKNYSLTSSLRCLPEILQPHFFHSSLQPSLPALSWGPGVSGIEGWKSRMAAEAARFLFLLGAGCPGAECSWWEANLHPPHSHSFSSQPAFPEQGNCLAYFHRMMSTSLQSEGTHCCGLKRNSAELEKALRSLHLITQKRRQLLQSTYGSPLLSQKFKMSIFT